MNVVQKKSQKIPLSLHKASAPACEKHRGRTYHLAKDQTMALPRYAKEWDGIVKLGKPDSAAMRSGRSLASWLRISVLMLGFTIFVEPIELYAGL